MAPGPGRWSGVRSFLISTGQGILNEVPRELTTLSLYTGAGGMDHGFEAAGFKTVVGVEMDPDAAATARANRDWEIIERDIHATPSEEILHRAGLSKGHPALLIGGPPCQP